jgi:hypothetical protein
VLLDDVPAWLWQRFHDHAARIEAPHAFTPVVERWRRAHTLGAAADGAVPDDHLLRGPALREHSERAGALAAAATRTLDETQAFLAQRGYLLLLADPDGVVVSTRGGGAFADEARRVRLIEGACWSEAVRGTNAIGTALTEAQPTAVKGHAHYGRRFQNLVCYAAPICGPDGRVVGVPRRHLVSRARRRCGRLHRDRRGARPRGRAAPRRLRLGRRRGRARVDPGLRAGPRTGPPDRAAGADRPGQRRGPRAPGRRRRDPGPGHPRPELRGAPGRGRRRGRHRPGPDGARRRWPAADDARLRRSDRRRRRQRDRAGGCTSRIASARPRRGLWRRPIPSRRCSRPTRRSTPPSASRGPWRRRRCRS